MDRAGITMGCDGVDDDLLLRYLMGDLDAAQSAEVEAHVRDNPACKKRLGVLRACLEADAAAEADPETPPEDLVSRTAEIVMSASASRVGECVGRKRFSLLDMAAVGVAALLLGALALPALQAARDSARRSTCSDQMRTLAGALRGYRENHLRYPVIGPYENAGMFAVSLAESSVISRETLQEVLLCPASELAGQVANNRAAIAVPSYSDLQVSGPVLLDRIRHFMGGSYAYRIGYMASPEVYVWSVGQQECRSPLLADSPPRCPDGRHQAPATNHGGCGQNVLFADGHVEFVDGCWCQITENHLFLNDDDQVAAGRGQDDIVLAPSVVTPIDLGRSTPATNRLVRFRYPRMRVLPKRHTDTPRNEPASVHKPLKNKL